MCAFNFSQRSFSVSCLLDINSPFFLFSLVEGQSKEELPSQESTSTTTTSSSATTSSSSGNKKKKTKKGKGGKSAKKRTIKKKNKKEIKLKQTKAQKLKEKKEQEKQQKVEELRKKNEQANAAKLAQQRASKATKYQQEAVRVLAKLNPLIFGLGKALTHPFVSSVASFAVDACNSAHDKLAEIKNQADQVNKKPNPDAELPWNKELVATLCKDGNSSLSSLNNMLKAAAQFMPHR